MTREYALFLKYPLATLLILPICKVFNARLIYVVRPFTDIKVTRRRRDWPEQFGERGAARIYYEMFNIYVTQNIPTLMMRYNELLARPAEQIARLAEFVGLPQDPTSLQHACAFVAR